MKPEELEYYGLSLAKYGEQKIKCPECQKRGVSKPNDKCLSVNLSLGVYKCHKCENFSGTFEKETKFKLPEQINAADNYSITAKALNFFEDRGISLSTLKRFRVTSDDQRIRFNYFRNDELFNIKSRYPSKKFQLEKDCEINFYNIDALNDELILITEGEIDALTSYECYPSLPVVSLPNGANSLKFLDSIIDRMEAIDEIIIATDGDSAGITARDALIVRFGTHRTSYVVYPDGTKDLNDVLVKYGKEKVVEIINNRKRVPVKAINKSSDYEITLQEFIKYGLPPGLKTGNEVIDCKLQVGLGEFVIVSGTPGSGKTTFLDYFISLICKNNDEIRPCILSNESIVPIQILRIAGHYVRRWLAGTNDFSDDVINAFTMIEERYTFMNAQELDDITGSGIVKKMIEANKAYGSNFFVVDPYNYIDREHGVETHAPILKAFANFCKKYNSTVFLVAHPRKMEQLSDGNYAIVKPYDIAFSSDFFNIGDLILSVWRDQQVTSNPVKIYITKVRNDWRSKNGEEIELDWMNDKKTYRTW